jgi:hypothetical protein
MEYVVAPQLGVDANTAAGNRAIRHHIAREAGFELLGYAVGGVAGRIAGGITGRVLGRTVGREASVLESRVVYRQGTFADTATGWKGNYIKGRQWASDNPLTTPNYSKKYGLPAENTGKPDWVAKGRTTGPHSTRAAPASHNNPANSGGGEEIVPFESRDVELDWFHMPD